VPAVTGAAVMAGLPVTIRLLDPPLHEFLPNLQDLSVQVEMPTYVERKILDRSPFETIDSPGVGWLVRLAAWVGREQHPGLKLGICGEHGGDPDSIAFFHAAGLDYVSCSPFRVPIARVAAAQAAVAGRSGPQPNTFIRTRHVVVTDRGIRRNSL
jgi:phosphoenolpyruvate synthase/pyruvate phosphate dikinase